MIFSEIFIMTKKNKTFFEKQNAKEILKIKQMSHLMNDSELAKKLPDGKKFFKLKNPGWIPVVLIIGAVGYRKYYEASITPEKSVNKFVYSEDDFKR